MQNENFEWKYIEGFSATASSNSSYTTIGTFPELINAKEAIVANNSNFSQVHITNIRPNSLNMASYCDIRSDATYNHTAEFAINFSNGEVRHRQIFETNASSKTYTILAYR